MKDPVDDNWIYISYCRFGFEEYFSKFDNPVNEERLVTVRKWLNSSRNEAERESNDKHKEDDNRVEGHKISNEDEVLDEILNNNSEDEIEAKDEPIENHITDFETNALDEKSEDQLRDSSILMKMIDETNIEECGRERSGKKTSPGKKKAKDSKEEFMDEKRSGEYEYDKPPMSPELLIAIAVINLDPDKDAGASCIDIVAFLSTHFPYFSSHYEECKVPKRTFFKKIKRMKWKLILKLILKGIGQKKEFFS